MYDLDTCYLISLQNTCPIHIPANIENLSYEIELYMFPGSSVVKNLAANAGVAGSIPESEGPLHQEMATHSNILAWEIPWTEKPGRLQSMGSQRDGYDLVTKQQQQQLSININIYMQRERERNVYNPCVFPAHILCQFFHTRLLLSFRSFYQGSLNIINELCCPIH